jgi:glycosyltransferase involved in cell wall biosynthesis
MFVYWRKWWEQGERLRWLSLCAQSLLSSRTATAIVADSQYAAASIARALRLPPQKITVIYPGVDARFFAPIQADAARAIREQHALDRYLLFVSVITPHKNLDTVLRAYAMARPRDTKLAVAGKEYGSHLRDVIRPLLRDLEIDRDVEILGMVPDESLPALYAGAEGLLHVSHTEGFGLPPLEAMACGTPVIASNGTSLPEVLDAAALLVDPNDLRAIAEAIDRLTSDAPLRQKLIACGRRRAARFCWSDAADQMLALYASVI